MSRLLDSATHLLNESNAPLFGPSRIGTFAQEAGDHIARGLKLAIVFHGSDIREPSGHRDSHGYSFFRDAPQDWVDILSKRVARNRREALALGVPVFVSTPDLLADVPFAKHLPLAIELDNWPIGGALLSRGLPRVLHLPSRVTPPIKGTQYIEPVLHDLEREGRIEWVRSPAVDHSAVQALIQCTDIVVDQIQTGSYGVAAVEAMASGRLVVGNVSSFSRGAVSAHIPIVDAEPSTFKSVMDSLLSNPDQMLKTASFGPAFVRRFHDGRESARVLDDWIRG